LEAKQRPKQLIPEELIASSGLIDDSSTIHDMLITELQSPQKQKGGKPVSLLVKNQKMSRNIL